MQDPLRVHGGQGGAQLGADEAHLSGTVATLRPKQFLERLASHELGPQPDPAVVHAHTVDAQHVGVLHAGQQPALALDPRAQGRVVSRVGFGSRSEQLQGHDPFQRRVPTQVNLSKVPLSPPFE